MVSPLRRPNTLMPDTRKHVIETYRHSEQSVTCTCGWQGSAATTPTGSDWTAHVAANRPPGKR